MVYAYDTTRICGCMRVYGAKTGPLCLSLSHAYLVSLRTIAGALFLFALTAMLMHKQYIYNTNGSDNNDSIVRYEYASIRLSHAYPQPLHTDKTIDCICIARIYDKYNAFAPVLFNDICVKII